MCENKTQDKSPDYQLGVVDALNQYCDRLATFKLLDTNVLKQLRASIREDLVGKAAVGQPLKTNRISLTWEPTVLDGYELPRTSYFNEGFLKILADRFDEWVTPDIIHSELYRGEEKEYVTNKSIANLCQVRATGLRNRLKASKAPFMVEYSRILKAFRLTRKAMTDDTHTHTEE